MTDKEVYFTKLLAESLTRACDPRGSGGDHDKRVYCLKRRGIKTSCEIA
jgi:hypothetical protein